MLSTTNLHKITYACFVIGIFSSLVLFGHSHAHAVTRSSIEKRIALISAEDQKELEFFFKELFYKDAIAYTLFGTKPVFGENIYLYPPPKCKNLHFLNYSLHFSNLKMLKGWKTWEKYRSLFPISSFLFHGNASEDAMELILIRKELFSRTILRFQQEFSQSLGRNLHPGKLLKTIENRGLFEALHQNSLLFGICLGFGKENAARFARFSSMLTIGPDRQIQLVSNPPSPTPGYASIEQEFQDLLKRHQSSATEADFVIYRLPIPCFVADPTSVESQELIRTYRMERKAILKKLDEGAFLPIVLEQLTS